MTKLGCRNGAETSDLLKCGLDPVRRHGQLEQPGASGVVDGIGNQRAHQDDRRFAAALRRGFVVLDEHGFNFRHPGEPRDFVGVVVRV